MPKPFFQIFADGKDISSKLAGGSVTLTIQDGVGVDSDTATIVIDDHNGIVSPPRTGVKLRIVAGYEDRLVDFGTYVVDSVTLTGWPQQIEISAQSIDAKSALKQQRSQSYQPPDHTTFKSIFDLIANRNELQLSISAEIGGVAVEFEAQAEEDDAAFLTRISDKLDASVTIKSGKLIAVPRGTGKSASGQKLPDIVVRRGINLVSYTAKWSDKPKHSKVEASYHDRPKAKKEVVQETASDAGPTCVVRKPAQSKSEAKQVAKSTAKKIKRAEASATFVIDGDPTARAETDVLAVSIRSKVDGKWRATSVSHVWGSSAYTTTIECEAATS